MKQTVIWGRKPVLEAIQSQKRAVHRLYIIESAQPSSISSLLDVARMAGLEVIRTTRRTLDELTGGAVHQGVVAEVEAPGYASLDSLLASVEKNLDAIVIILDGIEDPRNLGSILRSAAAFAVTGVVIPQDRSVDLTPAAVKAAAGGVEHVPVVKVTNLVRSMEKLKEKGLWIVGADPLGPRGLFDIDLTGKVGLVIGNEGKGMRRLVRETCDFLAQIPLAGQMPSLNASVAAGICLYEISRQRRERSLPAIRSSG